MRSIFALLPCLVLCACVRADPGEPGPFAVGSRTVTVTRPNASTFTARLFHPAPFAGENSPVEPAGGPYPVISFGHGFFQPVGNYQSTLVHLASHGYLVIATNSEGGLFPNHSNFASDILHCLTWLETQNSENTSELLNLVDTDAFALNGHSMGGGAAILAASDPRVRAVAPLAAANTNPSSIAASSNFFVPVRHIVGSADTIVTPATTVQMFNNSARPKQFISLQGGFHCGFIDAQGFGCDNGPMSRADQLSYVRRLLTEFFDMYLKRDQSRWPAVWFEDLHTDPRVVIDSRADSVLDPATQTVSVRSGDIAHAAITLTNLGPFAGAFEPELIEAPSWAAVSPSMTAPLDPQQSEAVTITLNPPAETPPGTIEILITARSLRDGGTRSVARVAVAITRDCTADLNGDGLLDLADINLFIAAFLDQDPAADLAPPPGVFDLADLAAFVESFITGCP